MDIKLSEMLQRRRRLIKYMLKKEGKTTEEFESSYSASVLKKNSVISKFTNNHLEELLKSSTKNVA